MCSWRRMLAALDSGLTHLIAPSCFSVCVVSYLLTHLERNHYPICCQANGYYNFTQAKNTRMGRKKSRGGLNIFTDK